MKPQFFKEHNIVYAKDQKEYIPLPALQKDNVEGEVVTCWRLTFLERLKILFTGRVWCSLWMFRDHKNRTNPLTPSRLTIHKKDVI